jgi:hypothetical protein
MGLRQGRGKGYPIGGHKKDVKEKEREQALRDG